MGAAPEGGGGATADPSAGSRRAQRRALASVVVLALVLVLVTGLVLVRPREGGGDGPDRGSAAPSPTEALPAPAPQGALLWGTSPYTERDTEAVEALERDTGRRFDVVRVFLRWDEPFPTEQHRRLRDGGRELVVSVATRRLDGSPVPWWRIASAPPDSPLARQLEGWAERLSDFDGVYSATISHEPELVDNLELGAAPGFVAAWRRFAVAVRDQGERAPRLMWIMTAEAFGEPPSSRRHASHWYPGDEYVDAVAADAYNWFGCRPGTGDQRWRSLEQLLEPFGRFVAAHPDEEVWLAEWGTVEDPQRPGRKAEWLREALALVRSRDWERLTGVAWFSSRSAECPWDVRSSSESLRAFARMARETATPSPARLAGVRETTGAAPSGA